MKVILRKILNRIYIYLNFKPKLLMYILLGENTDKKYEIKNEIPGLNNKNIFFFCY